MNTHLTLQHLMHLPCLDQLKNVCIFIFLIILFDWLILDSSTNNKKAGNAAKAKDFKRDYDLLSYKFVFQLALKENNVVYISNITCETDIIEESKFIRLRN
jgi:hypothetical protein